MSLKLLTPRHYCGKYPPFFFPPNTVSRYLRALGNFQCLRKFSVQLEESNRKQSPSKWRTHGPDHPSTLLSAAPSERDETSAVFTAAKLLHPSHPANTSHLALFSSLAVSCSLQTRAPVSHTPPNAICVVSFRPLMQSPWIAPYLLASELHSEVPLPETLQSSWQHNQSRSDLQPFPRKLKPLPQKQIVHRGRKHVFWVKGKKKIKRAISDFFFLPVLLSYYKTLLK